MAELDSMYGVGAKKAAVKPLSQLKTPQDLNKKLEAVKRGRETLERQWQINLAFYKGRQYTYYNTRARKLMALPVDDNRPNRHRVRVVSNQIIVGAQSLLAKYLKTKPQMYATPGSGSDGDLRAAQMAERLLEYWWDDLQLDDALEEAMLWAIVAGQGYWKISWDKHAGKSMTFMLDPQGKPIIDQHTKEAFRGMLTQMGVQPQETTAYMGDVRVEVVSPFDLYVDPAARKFADAKWAIQCSNLDPDEIRVRYGKTLAADAVPTSPDESLPYGGGSGDVSVRKVYCLYVVPSAAVPKGRIVSWSGNELLEDKAWDYPTNQLPFTKFPGIRVPGELYDSSPVEHAIPLQKELNRTLSQVVEYKNKTINPQWIAPVGALNGMQWSDAPGSIWKYNPVGGQKPEQVQVGNLPPYVFEMLADIKARLDEIFGRTEVTEGQLPANLEAGVAIDLLQEMATDRFINTIRLLEMSLARAGQQLLVLAKEYYIEPRMLTIRGSGGATQVRQFAKTDIAGAVAVHVETGSALPRTRAGRQARIQSFMEMGMIDPKQAYKHVDMADLRGLQQQFAMDEEQANRENEKLDKSQPLNPIALQQAQQGVMQAGETGVNPDTQEPFESEEEFMAWADQTMRMAALSPGLLDNHNVHLDAHGMVIKSSEFENLPPEVQQSYLMHAQMHMDALSSLPQPEPQAPRTNLQIKATTGPSGLAKILQAQGVELTPDEAAEPPLETWVSDSVDKADVDGSGPGQDGGVNYAKVAQINADAQANALSIHNQARSDHAKTQASVLTMAQKAQQEAELHQIKLRQASAQADAAEAQAKNAKNPPKPQGGGEK